MTTPALPLLPLPLLVVSSELIALGGFLIFVVDDDDDNGDDDEGLFEVGLARSLIMGLGLFFATALTGEVEGLPGTRVFAAAPVVEGDEDDEVEEEKGRGTSRGRRALSGHRRIVSVDGAGASALAFPLLMIRP